MNQEPQKQRIGIYPGSFDPITNGHIDVIKRALKVVDRLVIAVAEDSTGKHPIFSAFERAKMIDEEVSNLPEKACKRVTIKVFKGLLADFCKQESVTIIIRGLRVISDFEYEFQMACANSKLNDEIQTIFIPASSNTQFISSRLVKEIARLGGEISCFTSENVAKKLRDYYAAQK